MIEIEVPSVMDGTLDMGWNSDRPDGRCGHIIGEWNGTDPTSERNGGDRRPTSTVAWSNDDEN